MSLFCCCCALYPRSLAYLETLAELPWNKWSHQLPPPGASLPAKAEGGEGEAAAAAAAGAGAGAGGARELSLREVRERLDAAHYGLDKIKDRIVQVSPCMFMRAMTSFMFAMSSFMRHASEEPGGACMLQLGPPCRSAPLSACLLGMFIFVCVHPRQGPDITSPPVPLPLCALPACSTWRCSGCAAGTRGPPSSASSARRVRGAS